MRLEEFSIRPHSGGQGRYQGGNGIVRKTRFLEPMTVSIVSGHRRIAPYGMAGGQAGLVGQNTLQRANGSYEVLAGISQVHVEVGDILSITTPGGGGFADYLNTDQA